MMQYYLGGYYLFILKNINFGFQKGQKSYTCSSCINDALFDQWAFTWSTRSYKEERDVKKQFSITGQTFEDIWKWTDYKLDERNIGWCNVFVDTATADEYRQLFFAHLPNVEMVSIYFDVKQQESFMAQCIPEVQYENLQLTGLFEILNQKIPEQINDKEASLGFDLIAIEISGHVHSVQCQDWLELIPKFNLHLNKWGLLDDCEDWQDVLDYLNDDTNGYEPLAWFVVKVNRVIKASAST
jgi:hypothetical protein